MKKLFLIIIFLINLNPFLCQNTILSHADLKDIVGSWEGKLTYLDYTTNEPFTMPANLIIELNEQTKKFILFNIYPDEPNANSTDTLSISEDGKLLNGESIKIFYHSENGNKVIITEQLDIDGNDNRPALIQHTYIYSEYNFSVKKDIRFVGETKWINRHIYEYIRKLDNMD